MRRTQKNIRSTYSFYTQHTENPVDIKTYININKAYNKFLIDKVIEGEEVTLPARLGTLSVIGKKQEIKFNEDGVPLLPPNWVKTKELWKKCPECKARRQLVYCTNDHTNGVRYKYLWSKARVLVSNKMLYSLILTRTNKRRLYDSIKKGKEYYVKFK